MMIWPTYRKRVEQERARAEAATKAQVAAADERRATAEKLAFTSRVTNAGLRRQLEMNGFTELLQKAWGGRNERPT